MNRIYVNACIDPDQFDSIIAINTYVFIYKNTHTALTIFRTN